MKKMTGVLSMTAAVVLAAMALQGCGGAESGSAGSTVAQQAAQQSSRQSEGTTDSGIVTTAAASDKDSPGAAAADVAVKGNPAGQHISFWHSMGGVNGEALTALVDEFNRENPDGIQVKAEYQGAYDDAINKLKSAQIGNMGADLVQVYDIGTRFMVDSGWIIPMQRFIDADSWDASQLEENIAAYYTVDDTMYSMPFNSSTPILYYNKDIFDKADIAVPDSLDGIAASGQKLLDAGAGEVISLGIYGWFFEQFILKQGVEYADNQNGRAAAATAVSFDKNGSALKLLNSWKGLYESGFAPNVGKGGDAGLADFSSGKAAMTLGSTASLKQILNDINGKFELGTAYFPKVSESDEGGVSIGGASLWALNNQNPDKAAATWEFVKFLVSPKAQAFWNAQTGYFPVTVKAHDEPVFKENIAKYPQFMTAIDQLHASGPRYAGALLSVFPEARKIVETEIENMLNHQKQPEQAVSDIASQINQAIEEYSLLNS